MAAPANELQAALVAILGADTDVSAFISDKIFDRVPGGALLPYITFGPADEVEDDAECIPGADHTIQIDVWSTYQGGHKECKDIAFAVKRAIHLTEYDLPTHALGEMRVTSIRYFKDPDGVTSHGILTVEAPIEEL